MSLPSFMPLSLVTYSLSVSLICFFLMGLDKHSAKTGKRRIPEATLLALALLGGAAGGLAGMLIFRHKTRHAKFRILLPLLFVLNVIVLWGVLQATAVT